MVRIVREEDGALVGGLVVGAVVVALCFVSFFIGKKAGVSSSTQPDQ
ncbi:MAG: hypothetical protein WC455_09340 [Dehalococcoidia bacterium]